MASSAPRLRILATNDLLGSFHPWPTSYGRLPGGNAIRATVERSRATTATLWADAGDFAQGGVVSTLTGGLGGFTAMDMLCPDVAVAGNHEFDWGFDIARAGAARMRAPLLCANVPDSGLPATATLDAGGVPVGVVGCTVPQLFRLVRHPRAPVRDTTATILDAARALRADGCELVVAVVHDGVDWSPGRRGQIRVRPRRFARAVAGWSPGVDLVVAGHTLGRWVGPLRGVPVLQPWAFGQEVGVVEFDQALQVRRFASVAPTPVSPWDGCGADLIAAAEGVAVGRLARPLRNRLGADLSLPRFTARAIAEANGCGAGIFGGWELATGQPPLDGGLAYLAAGRVSEADVLRLVPYQDDSVVSAVLAAAELRRLRQRRDLAVWQAGAPRNGTVRVALSRYRSVDLAADLGREIVLEASATGVRDSLRARLRAGTDERAS